MLSDIEIAQQAKMLPITEVAAKLGIGEEDIEMYGRYKAKLSMDLIRRMEDKPAGKLVLVTAITPTPAGEGKSTTTVGLAQGLAKIDKSVIVALREPSLGPCMGVKGGAAAVILRWCRWKISTCILQVISMRSHLHTCFFRQWSITMCSRAML